MFLVNLNGNEMVLKFAVFFSLSLPLFSHSSFTALRGEDYVIRDRLGMEEEAIPGGGGGGGRVCVSFLLERVILMAF